MHLMCSLLRLCQAVVAILFVVAVESQITLPLHETTTPDVGAQAALIVVAGRHLPLEQYIPVTEKIKRAMSPTNLWVSIVEASEDIAVVRKALYRDGLSRSSPVFVLGHSFKGSTSAQEHVFRSRDDYAGIIVIGSALLSPYRQNQGRIPFMSINGDMDGFFKPLRSAVSYFHSLGTLAKDPLMHPVLLLPGHNHLSLVSTPAPPLYYKRHDLLPTVPEPQAHETLAALVSAFIRVHGHLLVGADVVPKAKSLIMAYMDSSRLLLKPMVSLLELEANHQLRKPCDSDMPSPHCPWYAQYPMPWIKGFSEDVTCYCGNPWIAEANRILADPFRPAIRLQGQDAIHPLETMMPVHHPHIWNSCVGQGPACRLNVTTVSFNVYERFDEREDSAASVSAREIAVKLKSRQALLQAFGDPEAGRIPVSAIDGPTVCQEINQRALEIAQNALPVARRSLYAARGVPIVFEMDSVRRIMEPFWALETLGLSVMKRAPYSKPVLSVRSPSFVTSVNLQMMNSSLVSGMHYCKLVSAARLYEFMFTDGLRPALGY